MNNNINKEKEAIEKNLELEKALAEATIKRKELVRNFYSTGFRELDEMLGGGFAQGTLTLVQQDIGSGGEIILSKIIELQLKFSNIVLVILTDPTALFIKDLLTKLKNNKLYSENILILNLAELSLKNINILGDKHEISLAIHSIKKQAFDLLLKKREENQDEEIQLFSFIISLNPFVLNLSNENLMRIINDLLLDSIEKKSIDIMLINKDILVKEIHARIQSLCHCVIDLNAYFEGIQKKFDIRILKLIGRFHDQKIEPYILTFDEKLNDYIFRIKSAFLTSFETFRNLLNWNLGSIYLSRTPYVITPISYIDSFLEIPRFLDSKRGIEELQERSQGIGRKLTSMVENLYFLEGFALFKSVLETASLMGWGESIIEEFQEEENLIKLKHLVNKEFKPENFKIFLEGFYKGIILRTLNKRVTYIEIKENINASQENLENFQQLENIVQYKILIKFTSK